VTRTLAVGMLVVSAAGAMSCRGNAAPPPPAAPADVAWREIGAWSGTGPRQTESFEVSQFAMRLRWQVVRETAPGQGHFTVTLHSAVSGRPLQTLIETTRVESGEVLVADDLRPAHFVVDAAHVEWRMVLDQPYARETK
jgi:hypothetical protein